MKDKFWETLSGIFGFICIICIGGVIVQWQKEAFGAVFLAGLFILGSGWLAIKCAMLAEPQYVKTGDQLIRREQFRQKKWWEKL